MKDNFKVCLDMLLSHEGGFVNHPKDPGGMTNLGVTKAVYDSHIGKSSSKAQMMALTYEDVAPIYKKNYWDKAKCDDLPSGLDWAVFDWGVNSGMSRPVKAMQKSIKATVDGGVGPQTLKAVNAAEPKEVIKSINKQRQKFYESLKTFETFGKGWTRRNKETLEQALKMLE